MKQVAAEAGVSVSTVSKVLNGRYGVGSETVAHVTEVITRLGYEASLVARSLRNHRTNVIGVLVVDLEPFSSEVLKGAADAIRGSGYELVAYSAGGRVDEHVGWERRYLSRVMGTLVDGAVLVTPTVTDVEYDRPIVAVDPHTGPSRLPTVAADNLQGARIGVEHLLELGHTRIGMVTGRHDLVSAQLREQGYRDALAAAGIPVDEALLQPGSFEPEPAREAARTLLSLPDPPTAVFAANDLSALATLEVAAELGIDVPAQLSVVGFDNVPESALAQPPLTTVQQPMRRMGHEAVTMLLSLIEGTVDVQTHLTLGTDLVPRQSTAPPAAVATTQLWRNPEATTAARVADLVSRMTLPEKVAQLSGDWGVDPDVGDMAPMLRDAIDADRSWQQVVADGLGQLTRPFGTAPVEPREGLRALEQRQRDVMAGNRFGIPAQVHEECLTGLAAWRATVYPSPLCWAASFDPALVEAMAARIGATMRRLGVHQGLAPVLDVVRDLRWGRVEETLGEDPFLVGLIGSAYVRGLEGSGVVATLKHFAGYSASRAARNLAPVAMGPRELADVLLPPFEMALRAGARSVMNSYTDIDGVPTAADTTLLSALLRDTLGFRGTVVADYFSISFLRTLHRVAESTEEAARLALEAGIDVELPSTNAYGDPLLVAVADGTVDEKLVDRALSRVLQQKCELGLLDATWQPAPPDDLDLDDAGSRALALDLARRSVVLLANDGTLPLAASSRLAVVGPRADTFEAMLGCYSFPMHVLVHHPEVDAGIEIRSVRQALADSFDVTYAQGCPVAAEGTDDELAAAVAAAATADVCVAVLGDQAGLFGQGTSGEGCDVTDLRLPGRQEELLEALLATGTPVVAVLLVGRPYDLSRQSSRLAGVVCGFFPGEEGAQAVADVLAGRVNPSGRLPVSFPGAGTSQPATYLAASLGQRSDVSVVDPTPLFPFGHGLSYATATWEAVSSDTGPAWDTDGTYDVTVQLANHTDRAVSEVVQVYLHDVVASVVRPAQQLVAAVRVDLGPGERGRASIALHADLTSFTGRDLVRVVEPGAVSLRVGASSTDIRAELPVTLTGPARQVGAGRVLAPTSSVDLS